MKVYIVGLWDEKSREYELGKAFRNEASAKDYVKGNATLYYPNAFEITELELE